jgi:hypothetical protein
VLLLCTRGSNLCQRLAPDLCFAPVGMLESDNRIVGLSVVSSEKGLAQVLCWESKMEHGHAGRCPLCETTEIHIFLRRQEDYITDNRNSIFSLTGRVHSQGRDQGF